MSKLLDRSLKKLMIYAGIVVVCTMPIYYITISNLWEYEMAEHNVVLTPEASREDTLLIVGAITMVTIIFFILMLGGFILLNRRISKRMWQPFYKSLRQISNFDLQQQTRIPFEPTDIEEFAELNNSLDKLIAGNIAAFMQQKEFADNASHELQTPLAIVQSKLDLLLQNRSLTTEQYEIIEEALKAVSRVNRINKNLLLLTKIENSQFMDKESINFSELVHSTLKQFQHFSDDKQIEIKNAIDDGVVLSGNKILIEILLNNLLNNAIRHSAPGSVIGIQLSKQALIVSNTGEQALQSEQLFKRFATASTQSPGTGLGLALVKQICSRYSWDITYAYERQQHVFTLNF